MGAFAREVQTELRETLAAECPTYDWHEEYGVAGTPVDVVGVDAASDALVAVELEMRRADPANNAVKLLRALDGGTLDASGAVVVCQVFSGYYDLASGGVSTKRENAEFVGRLAERAFDRVAFHPLTLPFEPPKRGGDPPAEWARIARETARDVAERAP